MHTAMVIHSTAVCVSILFNWRRAERSPTSLSRRYLRIVRRSQTSPCVAMSWEYGYIPK